MTDLQLRDAVQATLVMKRKNDKEKCVPDYVIAGLKEECVSLSDVQLRRIRDQVQAAAEVGKHIRTAAGRQRLAMRMI